jgi:hypothetical protein
MKTAVRILIAMLVGTFGLGGVATNFAVGQETGKPTVTVLAENHKVRVWENRYRPGDENASQPASSIRVIRVLNGGTFLWTYEDGKTEKVAWKTGDVKILNPGPQFAAKNVGNTDIVLYVVMVK